MNEPRDPAFPAEPAPGSDEALSAYLLGELDGPEAEAFERRLSAEPALRAGLDALAGALVALGGVDDVAEPEGFAARLDARLDAERAVPDLNARRRRQRWSAVLTAAAGVVVMAVAGVQVLGGANDMGAGGEMEMAQQDSADEAMEESAGQSVQDSDGADMRLEAGAESAPFSSAPAPLPAQEAQEYSAEGGGSANAPEETADDGFAPAPASAGGPVILDEGAELSTDDELRARFVGAPEAEQLRGMRRDEATETAVRHEGMVREAGPFASGVRPDTCLDEVRGGPDGRVVARVELLRWQGGESLAYVIGLPGPGSAHVDRWELWLMAPQGCDTRRFLTWE